MLEWIKGLLSGDGFDAWMKKWFSNDWMTNDDFKGKAAHALGGYAVMMTVGYLTHSFTLRLIAWALLLLYTIVKEFWYDARYETPTQGFQGGLTDLKWYHVGACAAMIVATFL